MPGPSGAQPTDAATRPAPAGVRLAPPLVAPFVALLALAWPATAVAGPPEPHWSTLETAHFRIHHYDEERALAERAAVIAENAFAYLTRVLNWTPSGRVELTLVDQTDSANGFANSLPYNYIFGFGVPPDNISTLNDFDDWVQVLITHELTHVVHLDTTLGLSRLVNFLRGKVINPNQVQPNWFIEGLAVLQESTATTAGRIRSSLYDMFLRAPTLEGRLYGLDGVSNGPRAFPGGTAAYLYGSWFLKYLQDRFGPEKIAEISHRYGSRIIPFSLNRVAREALGAGYAPVQPGDMALWDDFMDSLRRRYALQADAVRRRGLTPVTRMTFGGEGTGAPAFFRDGTLVYQLGSSYARSAFVHLDPRTGRGETIVDINAASHPQPTPDGKALVFEQVNYQVLKHRIAGNAYADWNDVMWMDLATHEQHPLTNGARGHEPEVSPDGTRVACTVGRVGAIDLAVVPITGGEPTRLGAHDGRDIAFTPTWSPDGKRIAYSRWKPGGFRDIHVYDLETGGDRPLMVDRAIDTDPRWTPDGRFIVFSSDRTGIYNVFAWEEATGRLYQVTNVLGGAFQPAVSPDGKLMAFTGFSADGFDVYEAPFEPASWPLAEPFVNPRDDASTDGTPVDPDLLATRARAARPAGAGAAPATTEATRAPDAAAVSGGPSPGPTAAPGATPSNDGPDAAPRGDPPTATGRARTADPDADATETVATATAAPPADLHPERVVQRITPYRPWRYMYPRSWNLQFSSGTLGLGPEATLTTAVADPVGNHNLGLQATFPRDGSPSLRADYSYAGLWPSLGLSATRAVYMANGLVVDGENQWFLQHAVSYSGFLGLPVLRKPDRSADIIASYGWNDYGMTAPVPTPDPTRGITTRPDHGPGAGAFVGWYYSDVQSWNYSVSGQEGRHLEATLGVNDPALGSRFHTAQVGWNWTEYWTPPWAKLQALGLSYSGGVGIGDKRDIFAIGGFYEQDLVRSFFLNRRQCCLYLRGYRAGSIYGDQFHILATEYRVPLLWFERGYQTFPIYFRRLWGAAFVDSGNAFYGDFRWRDLRYGVGGELRLEVKVGYYVESLLQLGVAKGLSREGITDWYFASAFPF